MTAVNLSALHVTVSKQDVVTLLDQDGATLNRGTIAGAYELVRANMAAGVSIGFRNGCVDCVSVPARTEKPR